MSVDWDAALANETGPPGDDRPSRRVTPLRVVVGLAVLASFGVWAYAFSGLPATEHPDTFDRTDFVEVAEPRCVEFRTWLDSVPLAINATSAAERANDIDLSTDQLERLIDDLESMIVGSDRDVQILTSWIADYRVFVGDRRRYAEALRVDPDAPFQLTPREGRQITRPIDNLASVNKMESCSTPPDV